MSVSRLQALLAQVNWMGAYEGRNVSDVSDTIEQAETLFPGLTPEEMNERFDIPADMVEGYRLALREYRTEERRVDIAEQRRTAVAALKAKRPDLTIEVIRKHVASVIR